MTDSLSSEELCEHTHNQVSSIMCMPTICQWERKDYKQCVCECVFVSVCVYVYIYVCACICVCVCI